MSALLLAAALSGGLLFLGRQMSQSDPAARPGTDVEITPVEITPVEVTTLLDINLDLLRLSDPQVLRRLLATGALRQVSQPVRDPGNHDHLLVLAEDPSGMLAGFRVLICVNGTPNNNGSFDVHAVVVPAGFTDPVEAAAWSYQDPAHPVQPTAKAYRSMAVRR
ncbi:MAG TPA: hypothetical protein VFP72_14575 [Kineosporiaceae bacterium]|nr:hypothetical protein [Kineosporiaceae bacterium]